MKRKLTLQVVGIVLVSLIMSNMNAQVVKTKDREYKKAVKQKTKELTKKGYTAKGSGTVELYVKKAVNLEFDTDENGEQKNSVVYTSAVDPTYEGAATACRAAARAALAGNIETSVGELIKRSLNSDQISMKSADGINQVITAGKQLIAQKISMEDTYILYREIKDERSGKTILEVEYASSYSRRLAMQKAQEYVREELKDEAEDLHKDLDKIFNLD